MGGSPSSTTTTVDPVYNKGMLELSKEQQGWAKEMYNMFKFGVKYDPEEVQYGKMVDGKWQQEAGEQGTIENPEWTKWNQLRTIPGVYDPETGRTSEPGYRTDIGPEPERFISNMEGFDKKTLGEIYGYDPDAQVSEMQHLQNLVEANQGLLGLQTETERAKLEAAKGLIPLQTETEKKKLETAQFQLGDVQRGIEQRAPVREAFFRSALTGIDPNKRADEAQAEVQAGFKKANAANRMDTASYGLDPSSGRYAALTRGTGLAEASGIAGARTAAKERADDESFKRLTTGLQMGV